MKVSDVRRNLVPWTADGEGALPELGQCSVLMTTAVRWLATSRLFCVEFDDIAEVCWPTLIKSSVRLTEQPLLTSIIQKRRLMLFGHLIRMDESADVWRILTAVPQSD